MPPVQYNLTSVIHHKFIHATGAESGPHGLCHNLTGIDVADKLWDPLWGVCALLKEDNWSGLSRDVHELEQAVCINKQSL